MPFCFLTALLFLFLPAHAQTAPPATNAATATPPAAVPMADVITQAQEVIAQLKAQQADLAPDTLAQSVRDRLPSLQQQIEARAADDQRAETSRRTLANLQAAQGNWQTLAASLNSAQRDLSDRVRKLDNQLWELSSLDASWQSTRRNVATAKAPPEMSRQIEQVLAEITVTKKLLATDQTQLYSLQNEVAGMTMRVKNGLDAVNKSIDAAQAELFKRTQPPLWDPASLAPQGASPVVSEQSSLQEQIQDVTAYLSTRTGALLIHLLLLAVLIAAFVWLRNATRDLARDQAGPNEAERVFGVPVATALLLALLASNWLYPVGEAPRLLWALIGAVALVPAVIIVRRLITPALLPLLYALVAAYVVDQVRFVARHDGVLARFVLLAELVGASIFILTALHSRSLSSPEARAILLERVVRVYLHVAFFLLVAAGFANSFGYVALSFRAGDGVLQSSYLAVVVYAAVRIVDALAGAIMSVRPFSRFGMVRRHRDLVYRYITLIVRWTALALWVVATLKICGTYESVATAVGAVMVTKVTWGWLSFELGSALAFPVTVWAAFALSRFIRFALQEEVYPHFNLGRGVDYAASTMVHYSVLVIGFLVALGAMGVDLSKFTILAGAFGVGLGFGLQNIMNNFVSGLILLFERPVKVGDTIQIDAATIGRVERIGIRASVILLNNGSELILPNGNLISNPVTNWTLSNCERLIEIPVNIAPKADPNRALAVLIATAKAHASILKNPAPQAILVALGAAATSLKLRCWTDSEEDWMKITSDLTLAVQSTLEHENIALG